MKREGGREGGREERKENIAMYKANKKVTN